MSTHHSKVFRAWWRICRVLIILPGLIRGSAANAASIDAFTIHVFHHSLHDNEGIYPRSLTVSPDGELYGTTKRGGAYDVGTIFGIAKDGKFSTLHSFRGVDGIYPSECLVLGVDGLLYGATSAELRVGSKTQKTIFRISTSGDFNTLYTFPEEPEDPDDKIAVVVIGIDRNAYAINNWQLAPFELVAAQQFASHWLAFQITNGSGFYSNRKWLPSAPNLVAEGRTVEQSSPNFFDPDSNSKMTTPICGSYIAARDEHVWGVGIRDIGVFRSVSLDPKDGMYEAVPRWLNKGNTPVHNPNDGILGNPPSAPNRLAEGKDGNIYLVTSWEWPNIGPNSRSYGIVQITPEGIPQKLFSLDDSIGTPVFGLLRGRDGYLYGLAQARRPGDQDVIYRFLPGNQLEIVYKFTGNDSAALFAGPLVQTADGSFYGSTWDGGEARLGTIFKITITN